MGIITKIIGKRKLQSEDIPELFDKLHSLSQECLSAELVKNSMQYAYLLYSETNDIFENTDYEESFSNPQKEYLYYLQFLALSEIIDGLAISKTPDIEPTFKNKTANNYISIGLTTKYNFNEEQNNSNFKPKQIPTSLKGFFNSAKRYYEKSNNHKRAIEMVTLINEYFSKNKEDDIEFEKKVDNKKKIYTKKGMAVQSLGEQKIADYLYDKDIDFDYDKKISLKFNTPNKHGYTTELVRPDFYLTEFGIIVEYWGMKGEPDYDNKMDWKKTKYAESKTKYISIYKEDLPDLEAKLENKLKRLGVNL